MKKTDAQKLPNKRSSKLNNPQSHSVPPFTLFSSKRPPPSPVLVSEPSKRTRLYPSLSPPPMTPDQPTHTFDPDCSGSTSQSKNEDYTRQLLQTFMAGVLSVLESGFRTLRCREVNIPSNSA